MKQITCIVCPKGCPLSVDENNDYLVTGAGCPRGMEYGKQELQNPTRVVTTTVTIRGAALPRCPVKTAGAIPKALVEEAVRLLDKIVIEAPVACGTVVIPDVLGTGIDFVTSRSMKKKE